MKTASRLVRLSSAALFSLAALTSRAQTSPWQTLYDAPGDVWTALLDPFAGHPQPSLFVGANSSKTAANNPFSVEWLGPFDGVTSPASVVSDSSAGVCAKLGFDPSSGLLYSVGIAAAGSWQVRISTDGGGTWTTDSSISSDQALGFAADGVGNVFVCGTSVDSNGDGHWVVRKRDSSGQWATIQYWGAARKYYAAAKMHIASGYLFVVGIADNMWAAQRMNLATGVWDPPYTGAPKAKKGGGVAVTSHGTDIYMLAWGGGVAGAPASVVLLKRANLGTASWTIVKTFTEGTQINMPYDLGFDTDGNLYVIGASAFLTSAGTYNNEWIVRRLDAVTGVWQWWTPLTNDPASQQSYAKQVCVDSATGALYVVGSAQDIVGGHLSPTWRAIVQKWAP